MGLISKIVPIAALLTIATAAHAENLTFAADSWCPYNCEPGATPGYAVEITMEALKAAGHKIEYKLLPWQRALDDAKSGKINGVFGATADDGKTYALKQGKESIGFGSNCVFVQASSSAKYSKPDDLAQFKKIGVINEYSYSEDIDVWVKNPANKGKLDSIAGDDAVQTNAKKLDAGRVEAVIEDAGVMAYTLKKLGLEAKVKSAGCSTPIKLYTSFSSKTPKVDEIVKALDEGVVKLRKSGKIQEITAKYSVNDFK